MSSGSFSSSVSAISHSFTPLQVKQHDTHHSAMHCTQNQRHRVLPKPFLLLLEGHPQTQSSPHPAEACHAGIQGAMGRQEGTQDSDAEGKQDQLQEMKITDENLVYLIHLNFLRPHLWPCTLCVYACTYNKQENTSQALEITYGTCSQTNSGKVGWRRKRPTGVPSVSMHPDLHTLPITINQLL